MQSFKNTIIKLCFISTLLFFCGTLRAQNFEFTAMGFSGSAAQLDTVVETGDTLFVRAFFTKPTGWTAQGVALDSVSRNVIVVHYYASQSPIGAPLLSVELPIDSTNVFINNGSNPATIDFRFRLSGRVTPAHRSFQIEMGVYGRDNNAVLRYSLTRSSYLLVNGIAPVNVSTDDNHRTFLRLAGDGETLPPALESPLDSSLVTRIFYVVFSQPEIAERGTLYIRFTNTDTLLNETPKTLYITNVNQSTQKIVQINGDSLYSILGIDSIRGGTALNQNTWYNVTVAYRDTFLNTEARDIAGPIFYDSRTETGQLIEPRINSYTDAPNIRVIYDLGETPDSVKLIFTLDSISIAQDLNSPHILTLSPTLHTTDLLTFLLDGNNIGTNNPLVIRNNNGILDRLISQAIYTVTLSYGDTLNNPDFTVSNRFYVWPRDLTTIPPSMSLPLNNSGVSETFRAQFNIPEVPLLGTVRMLIEAQSAGVDPGSPHSLILGNLASSGTTGMYIYPRNLIESELVTQVQGPGTEQERNRLVHNQPYRISISYRDYLNNSPTASGITNITYDNVTDPITVTAPLEGDTFRLEGTNMNYVLPERAIRGTLKIIFTQTDGPELDTQSPHILYLTDVSPGSKNLFLRPALLSSTFGLDSAVNGGSLIARGIYSLAISYQDSLFNPQTTSQVNNLSFPSGSTVFVRGETIGDGAVNPGTNNNEAFKMAFVTTGGSSALRSLRLRVAGSILPTDLQNIAAILWQSIDSSFSPTQDIVRGIASPWQSTPAELLFDSVSAPFTDEESFFFVSLAFRSNADDSHFYYLQLLDPTTVDCGGDPILATSWPIGNPDVALFVDLVSFRALQDTLFGSLIVEWTVASEYENAGFNLYRKAQNEADYYPIASYANAPELVGRGNDPSNWVYRYRDRQLIAGLSYSYHIEAVSYNFDTRMFDVTATGVPRFLPEDFDLGEAYPNPFNSEVSISYTVPKTSQVSMVIYNLLGEKVRILFDQVQAPSDYVAKWDGRNADGAVVPSGVYLYRLETDQGFFKTKKMLFLR